MWSLRETAWRLAAAIRRRRLDRDTAAEMRFHLDMETRAGLARGLSDEEARRQARLRAGSLESSLDAVRDERGLGPLDGTLADLRHACAALRRQPGFALTVGSALALAVALNTLIVAIADGVLRRPLPYPEPDRLVRIFEQSQRNPMFPVSIANYLEVRRSARTLSAIALYTRDDLQLMHGDRPERLDTVAISDTFFPTLGILPALGRNFGPNDLRADARVVILSHRLWATRFERDPAIVGKAIRLDRQDWVVVGVMPEGLQHVGGAYRSPLQGETVALWRPLAMDLPEQGLRSWHFTNAVARLKPGVTVAQASGDINVIMTALRQQYPAPNEGVTLRVETLAHVVTASSRATVRLLLAAGALVLLIAAVNVAGLCVARVLARRQELAIRQALGAGRWRVVRAVLSENVVVGAVGGAAGLAIAAALLPVLRTILPADFPRLHEVRLSSATVGFAWAAALAASLAAGFLPALAQSRDAAGTRLATAQSRTVSTTRGARRLRSGLVVGEVALACLLCVATLLLVRSAMQLAGRDHGFVPGHVLTFSLSPPPASYPPPERAQLYADLLRGWSSLPGVRAAGMTTNLPWTGYDENTSFDLVGRAAPTGDSPQARFQAASPGFFRALRMRLIAGRLFDDSDGPASPPVVVVNQALARRWFPAGDIVGQRLQIWGDPRTVVGVVADIRDDPAGAGAEPAFWFPLSQQPFRSVQAVLRTDVDPLTMISAAADVVRRADRELPMSEVRTLDDVTATALGERRFALWFFQAFAVLALVLAAFGIYGVLAYDVQQRRRELGVRMAMGATRGNVARMVLSNGLRMAGLGILLGVLAAPIGLKALATLLFGVSSADPASLAIGPLLLGSVAALAAGIPAWRASRSEALAALREQ